MPKFRVNEGKQVNAGEGVLYVAGQELDLTAEEGAGLVENGTVSPVSTPASKPAPSEKK